MKRLGLLLVALTVVASVAAPLLAPNEATAEFRQWLHAPPTAIRVRDAAGSFTAPFIHPWRLENLLEQRFALDQSRRIGLVWFSGGRLLGTEEGASTPLLLLGADSFGRDVFARVLYGGRTSLAVALDGRARGAAHRRPGRRGRGLRGRPCR